RAGADFVVKTDIQGAATWRSKLEGCVTVRLLGVDPAAPLDEHRRDLIARLQSRGATEREQEVRLEELQIEYASTEDTHTVVNPWNDADAAVAHLRTILERERENTARPAPRLRNESS